MRSHATPTSDYPLRDFVDQTVGQIRLERRLMLGDLDILCNTHGHIDSIEIRKNPGEFNVVRLKAAPADVPNVELDFVVPFDTNNVFSIELNSLRLNADPEQHMLEVDLGLGADAESWVRIADNAVASVTGTSLLRRFQFTDVDVIDEIRVAW